MKVHHNAYYHSITFEPSRCRGEMACMRNCPVQAIRVRHGKARMLEEKCIDCGECINACKNQAIVALTEAFPSFSRFKYTVAIPSLALYTQFGRNVHPRTILNSLKKAGFDEVIDMSAACISVVKAMESYIKNYSGPKPLLSSICPTCIKLIQSRYPSLLGRLIPVVSPMELAAKEAKKEITKRLGLLTREIGVIYLTPCPSKMLWISHKVGEMYSDIDGAIPISDVYNLLYDNIHKTQNIFPKASENEIEHYDIRGFGLNFARMDGLVVMMKCEKYIPVAGIENVVYVLEDIERGKLNDIDLVEIHACHEGCLGGPMVTENMYLARNKLMDLISQYGEKNVPVGRKDKYEGCELYYENFLKPLMVVTEQCRPAEMETVIEKINERKELFSRLPNIDCGACGSPTCLTFAEDVVNGDLREEDCIFLHNEMLKEKLKVKIKDVLKLQSELQEKCDSAC